MCSHQRAWSLWLAPLLALGALCLSALVVLSGAAPLRARSGPADGVTLTPMMYLPLVMLQPTDPPTGCARHDRISRQWH